MLGVRMLHVWQDWQKFIQIHQYNTTALISGEIMLNSQRVCINYMYMSSGNHYYAHPDELSWESVVRPPSNTSCTWNYTRLKTSHDTCMPILKMKCDRTLQNKFLAFKTFVVSWYLPYTPFKPNSSPVNFTGETSFSPVKRPVWKVSGEEFTGERRRTSPGNFSTYRGG